MRTTAADIGRRAGSVCSSFITSESSQSGVSSRSVFGLGTSPMSRARAYSTMLVLGNGGWPVSIS